MKMVFSYLPTQYDSLQTLYKKRDNLIQGKMDGGILVDILDPDTQIVIRALNSAIKNRENQPQMAMTKKSQSRNNGKTQRDKAKENYRSPNDKKRAKSEASQMIRAAMQGRKGKK